MEMSKSFLVKMIIIIILAALCVIQTIYHLVCFFGCTSHDKHLIVGNNDTEVIISYLNENSDKYVADNAKLANSQDANPIKPYLVKKTMEKMGKKEKTALTVLCNKGYQYKFYAENSSLGEYINTHGSNTMLHLVLALFINAAFIGFFVFLMYKVYIAEYGSTNNLKAKKA